MQIYIEYVIVNNIVVNAMILYLVAVILKRQTKVWRLLLSSALGTIYAVLLPYISFKYDFGIKVLLSIFMLIIAFRHHSIQEFVMSTVVFYMITFLFGGTVIGLSYMLHSDFVNALIYPNSLLISLMGIVVIAMTVLVKYFALYVENVLKRKRFYYEVKVARGDMVYCGVGYLDSGNRLYHNLSPVVVLGENAYKSLIHDDVKTDKTTLTIATINDKSTAQAYRLDSVEVVSDKIHQIYTNVYGVRTDRKFKDFDILLHSSM